MTLLRLLRRSLHFHWRIHAGVLLGAALGSAALIGALIVGDSVRESLRARALARLGPTHSALQLQDRFFEESLLTRLGARDGTGPAGGPDWHGRWEHDRGATVLALPGVAARQDGAARANRVQVLGVDESFPLFPLGSGRLDERQPMHPFAEDAVWLNAALAQQLRAVPGDAVVLRIHKPSALSRDAVITPRDDASVALRLTVAGVLGPRFLGDLDLGSSPAAPFNAFVRRDVLAARAGLAGRANLLLVAAGEHPRPETWKTRAWRRIAGYVPSASREKFLAWALPPLPATGAEMEALLTRALAGPGADDPDAPSAGWSLADAGLTVRHDLLRPEPADTNVLRPFAELATPRIFLAPAVTAAALAADVNTNRLPAALFTPEGGGLLAELRAQTNATPILTYLANGLAAHGQLTPYSMVTAAGPPYTPADLADDEMLVNDWLATDLGVKPGDTVTLTYYRVDGGAQLTEHTNRFRVRAVVPLAGLHADRTLMPEFPGLAKAESTQDWDAGFPLVHEIRDRDEAYWKAHRGTPKAFISLAAGRAMWANRFGDLTAIRWIGPEQAAATNEVRPRIEAYRTAQLVAERTRANLDPAAVGLAFQPVRERALASAAQGQDFGQLFLGFSFFLIGAALLLMALLFQFGLEQRLPEIGTLLALGFTPRRVRRLWLAEGAALALLGALLGVGGGVAYAGAMIRGLNTVWRDAVAGAALGFHATPASLAAGFLASSVIAVLVIGLALRRHTRRPARELLAGELEPAGAAGRGRPALWLMLAGLGGAAAVTGVGLVKGVASAPLFFGAAFLLLVGGLAALAVWLRRIGAEVSRSRLTAATLAARGLTRRRTRSLATAALLASGAFLVASIGVFRLDAEREAGRRGGGTGGFALIGEAALPVVADLTTAAGVEAAGLSTNDLPGVGIVPFRVRDGDEASCLNLVRAQRPRVLGVNPALLAGRGAFTFASLASGLDVTHGWLALRKELPSTGGVPEIPAIGDAASIQWALGKRIGDTLDYADENGRPVKLRLVGGVANSVLQGNLVIDEAAFTRLFPGESGRRFFLIDAPTNQVAAVAASLSRAFEDYGLELTPAARRLDQFNAVQNTYLGTFQVLGGIGLLLGSFGLGVVVLRNVLERRAELALLGAVGFPRARLGRLVLGEHAVLLALGLGLGVTAAALAVLPALALAGQPVPWRSLAVTLGGVALFGLAATWLATCASLRGRLVDALHGE
ncbi:MAG: FtsX-like permease family protein [Limisphaerales bacterium]